MACYMGSTKVVRVLLLRKEVDVNQINEVDFVASHVAVVQLPV